MSAEQQFPNGLLLRGYGLEGEQQPGAPLTIDLYLQGGPSHGADPAQLTLVAEQGVTKRCGPGHWHRTAEWREGEWICRRLHARLPDALTPGDYALQFAVGDEAVLVTPLAVGPSTRQFTAPPVQNEIGATLGADIRLAGFNTQADPDRLTVELVWQAQGVPAADAKVFVHLLDSAGAIVAQSDALPTGNAHASAWVAGEVIVDAHVLPLPAELPPGEYTLVAGMYDPLTGQRLMAIGPDGQRFADDAAQLTTVFLSAP